MSGALTALGDTLFPVSSIGEGISQDFSSTAHFLIRLRILHPTIAVFVAVYLIFMTNWINARVPKRFNKQLGWVLISLLVLQLLAGIVNVLLLAPVWIQMLHLLISDLVWISLVLFSAESLGQDDAEQIVKMDSSLTGMPGYSEA
jgi:heme A synthase